MFATPISIRTGDAIERDGFWFADLFPEGKMTPASNPSAALVEGVDYYLENGAWVFTAAYHRKRGYCCGNVCRHCPYGNSPADREKAATEDSARS